MATMCIASAIIYVFFACGKDGLAVYLTKSRTGLSNSPKEDEWENLPTECEQAFSYIMIQVVFVAVEYGSVSKKIRC